MTITADNQYPVVVHSPDGDQIARINPDATWSVKWTEVINIAYGPLTDENTALRAICVVLAAGRDNFRTSPWSDPPQPWHGITFNIHVFKPDDATRAALALIGPDAIIAYVNPNGMWSVDWSAVMNWCLLPVKHAGAVALVGFCLALYGAKDNFHTLPMD